MDFPALLAAKRSGAALSDGQIRDFMGAYVAGRLGDDDAEALLREIFEHGMEEAELVAWTDAMLRSGATLERREGSVARVDKHSTGGVGDKVSIPLAPAVAACGAMVPMISGRGLGHTGGTLDKLEAIPGLRTELSEERLAAVLDETGMVFAAQTPELVPADRKLYRLRDATGLVASIPLIASSIMSKKLAEGLDGLVLDVKFGSGAFLPDPDAGAELARTMISLGERLGVRTCAFQTSMAQPLGAACGHALEIAESFDCLAGGGPDDLAALVRLFGGEMLVQAGTASSAAEGGERIAAALEDGSAREVMCRVIEAQGGDPRCVDDTSLLPSVPDVERIEAPADGTIRFTDTSAVGRAVLELGGGRRERTDEVDMAVGVRWHRKGGECVRRGEVIAEVFHRAGAGLEHACALLGDAVAVGEPAEQPGLVLARLDA
ncbi:MAG: thymidine phosphorylase [Planctomycetota bacterium]|jgi:pyrimidine-nucleoside phosphorylase|nr:thymidine phosphorylase [Planctomycetota bacterium]MDP6762764.1 thymidine phosphorylase [Planctomycetota bacterium]MDP6989369.1 thymidine phosphorylase [Planctomycetota bacterium]